MNTRRHQYWVCGILLVLTMGFNAHFAMGQYTSAPAGYMAPVIEALQKKWPHNRTINLVFHGHSVPSGYRTLGVVNTLESYPYLTLSALKKQYPFAVINVIITAIGGEQAEQGADRFETQVLAHQPDVLFIDYALNDRSIGLKRANTAWQNMIKAAKAKGTLVVLLTPTPDYTENIQSPNTPLAQHSEQIRSLAKQYNTGLVDSYAAFKAVAKQQPLATFMAQNNHINTKGHQMVANAIVQHFIQNKTKMK